MNFYKLRRLSIGAGYAGYVMIVALSLLPAQAPAPDVSRFHRSAHELLAVIRRSAWMTPMAHVAAGCANRHTASPHVIMSVLIFMNASLSANVLAVKLGFFGWRRRKAAAAGKALKLFSSCGTSKTKKVERCTLCQWFRAEFSRHYQTMPRTNLAIDWP